MPALRDPRRERACQLRALGGDIAKSYADAGYAPNGASATRFFKHPEIVERVQTIVQETYEDERKAREVAVEEAGISKGWVLKRLKYLTDVSLQKREIVKHGKVIGMGVADGPTAVKCLTLASDIGGLRVQRHEIGHPGDFARMSDEELDFALVEQAKGLGIPEEAVGRLITSRVIDEAAE